MLKQATPPLEPETAWESVSSFNPHQQFSNNSVISSSEWLVAHCGDVMAGARSIPERICFWGHNSGGREEKDIQGLHACLRGQSAVWWEDLWLVVMRKMTLLCCISWFNFIIFSSMNASITIPRQRSTQRSPRNTTESDPAPDRSVALNEEDVVLL